MNQLLITQDGQPTTDYDPKPSTKLIEAAKTELISITYDLAHGTKYTLIRHRLMAQKRREAHIARIGLVRTTS